MCGSISCDITVILILFQLDEIYNSNSFAVLSPLKLNESASLFRKQQNKSFEHFRIYGIRFLKFNKLQLKREERYEDHTHSHICKHTFISQSLRKISVEKYCLLKFSYLSAAISYHIPQTSHQIKFNKLVFNLFVVNAFTCCFFSSLHLVIIITICLVFHLYFLFGVCFSTFLHFSFCLNLSFLLFIFLVHIPLMSNINSDLDEQH